MEDESKIQAQSLNLPKGGGAISGIGESFSPNEFSGTASMSIPLPFSACREAEPSIGLQYSSGSGNGPFGLGVSLSAPVISRATNKGTPRYNASDHFVIEGGNYLVPTAGIQRTADLNGKQYTVQQYSPKQQSDFSLIEYWQSLAENAESFWMVTSKEHIISIFGKTNSAKIANPDNPSQVFSWLLEEVYDAKGSHQLYCYKQEDAVGVGNATYENNRSISAQRYLNRVCYGNAQAINGSILLSEYSDVNAVNWLFELIFNYGEYNPSADNIDPYKKVRKWRSRLDPFSIYTPGFEIRTYRRCEGVMMFHCFTELGTDPVLVHTSKYHYDDHSLENGYISKLIGVTDTGFTQITKGGTYQTKSYPELQFAYSLFHPKDHQFQPLDAEKGRLNGLNGDGYSLTDLYGRGISGVLYADGQTVCYREPVFEVAPELEGASFSTTADVARKKAVMHYGAWEQHGLFPISKAVSGEGLSLSDRTGNGQLDLMVNQSGSNFYWQANANGSWCPAKDLEKFPLTYQAPNQTQINATGAGLSDLFQIRNNTVSVFPSAREKGFDSAIESRRYNGLPSMLESSEVTLIQFADLAGTGVPQLIKVESNKVSYWPNLSYGRFGKPIVMANVPDFSASHFEREFNTSRVFLADVDGSGTTDLLYVDASKIYLYLNQSGNQFSDAITIDLPHPYDNLDQISFADVYGQGTTCLVISYPHGVPEQQDLSPRFFCYDFCQHQKPYLLRHVDNQMGASTDIEYASSVDYYLADKKAGITWVTNIPFPVQVIAKTTISDGLTGSVYTSLYAYHHGYYDGEEREFKGFGRVDKQDTQLYSEQSIYECAEFVAPSISRTWYNVGCSAEYDALMVQYRKEYYHGDEDVFESPQCIITTQDIDEGQGADADTLTQAYAALAGTMIHQEVYGLDGSDADTCPYTVSESSFEVKTLQQKADNLHGVFLVEPRETLSYNYDRNPQDPQIQQQFTLQVDLFGNVLRQASIAYPRRLGALPDGIVVDQNPLEIPCLVQQTQMKVLCTTQEYANNTEVNTYQLGVPYQQQSYHLAELSQPAVGTAFSFGSITQAVDAALANICEGQPSTPQAVLQSWTRSIYSDDNNQPLSLGEAGLPLLPYQQQTAFESEENMTLLFVDNLEPDVLNVKLKQGFYRLDPDNNYWWNDGLRAEYNNLDKFYLPSKAISPATDPANALQVTESNTTYRYDAYALILIQTQDDYGNTSIASDIDYQTLQPGKLTDPNSISTEVSYDPLGQVVYTSVYGYENGQEQPVGFKPISEAPVNESATLAQIIGNPEQYLGAMQSYFFYDLFAYCKRQQPVCALSLVAENYAITGQAAGLEKVFAQRQEQDLLRKSGPSQLPMQIQLAYSDGLGRELQSKARVEPGEYLVFQDGVTGVTKAETDHRWLTTGAKVYNNKGDAVKEYEPYFSNTSDYVFDSALNTWGVSSELYYDPIGRLRKTITPKGFVIKQEHTPWETKSWDANDTIVDSHYYKANQSNDPHTDSPYYDKQLSEAERKNLAYVKKYFSGTPTVATMDNMGNVIVQQKTNQSPSNLDSPLSNDSTVIKSTLSDYSFYDVAGRLLKAADPRLSESGIFNFEMAYPMAAQDPITTVGVDAGSSWLLANSLGNPIYSCDARGTVISTNYDLLQRPIKIHAKKDSSTADVLVINQVVQQIIYGDTPNSGAPKYYNLRGQVVQNFESSGLSKTSSYALGGQPMASDQRFFSDYKTQGNWDDISQAAQQQLLQSSHYTNSASYDALGRVTAETDSDGNVISPQYHSSGLLNTLQLKAADDNSVSAYVDGISYDAKGQRQQVQYGNGTVTNYQYDPKTFAPIKITTSNNAGQAIQDIGYQYDPVGNVFQKNIFSEDSVCYANQQVLPISTYLYDALYQLIQGKGREKMGGGSSDSGDCSIDLSRPAQNDHQALQNYTEKYNYDTGSNLIKTQHTAGNTSWTREMVVSGSSNRSVINNIQGKDNPPTTEQVDQFFDLHGNQIKLQAIHPLQWDYANQLQQVTTIARDDGVNDAEYYVYNSSGQRLRKVQESYGSNGAICTINQTLYLGNLEIRQTLQGTDLDSAKVTKVTKEYHSLRLMDGDHGVATRTFWVHGEPPTGFEIPNMTYHLQDNLGSYSTQVNAAGEVIAREEYSPFGCSTLFIGSGAANELSHYRYSGKERDSVTGFYYYGFRYYATWLGRWLNPDPAGTVDGLNVYAFVGNNPVTFNDPDGNFRQHLARTGKWLKETARSVMNSAGKGISEAACKGFEVTRGLEDTLGAGLNAIAIFAIAGSLGGTAAGVAAAIVAFTLCGFLSMDSHDDGNIPEGFAANGARGSSILLSTFVGGTTALAGALGSPAKCFCEPGPLEVPEERARTVGKFQVAAEGIITIGIGGTAIIAASYAVGGLMIAIGAAKLVRGSASAAVDMGVFSNHKDKIKKYSDVGRAIESYEWLAIGALGGVKAAVAGASFKLARSGIQLLDDPSKYRFISDSLETAEGCAVGMASKGGIALMTISTSKVLRGFIPSVVKGIDEKIGT